MSNDMTLFKNGAAPSSAFRNVQLPATRLGEGTGGSPWARVSYKGKAWAIKNGARVDTLKRIVDGREENNPHLDIVILKGANHISRRWFKEGYSDGADNAPDCYSTMGLKPDAGSALKQSDTCLLCPHQGWGSKKGSKGKACSEYSNLAVVPAGDIENKIYGGPMLFAVPPNSLKPLQQYQLLLEANSFHPAQVHTRVKFGEGLFQLAFEPVAPLDDVQAEQVIKALQNPLVDRILNEEVVVGQDSEPRRTGTGATIRALPGPDAPAPAAPVPVQNVQPPPAQTVLAVSDDGVQKELAKLRAELAAAKAPAPKPEPELTPEQKEIAELRAALAQAKTNGAPAAEPKKVGRPARAARTPQVAPVNMDSEAVTLAAAPPDAVPAPGNDDALALINDTLKNASKLL